MYILYSPRLLRRGRPFFLHQNDHHPQWGYWENGSHPGIESGQRPLFGHWTSPGSDFGERFLLNDVKKYKREIRNNTNRLAPDGRYRLHSQNPKILRDSVSLCSLAQRFFDPAKIGSITKWIQSQERDYQSILLVEVADTIKYLIFDERMQVISPAFWNSRQIIRSDHFAVLKVVIVQLEHDAKFHQELWLHLVTKIQKEVRLTRFSFLVVPLRKYCLSWQYAYTDTFRLYIYSALV